MKALYTIWQWNLGCYLLEISTGEFRVFRKSKWLASDASHQGVQDFWCITRQCCMFFFQHSITKLVRDSSLTIAGWLSACFCVWLFCAGELKSGSCSHCERAAFVQKNFSPEMWDVVLLAQRAQWRRGWVGIAYIHLHLETFCKEM